jgi:hypothetical protein
VAVPTAWASIAAALAGPVLGPQGDYYSLSSSRAGDLSLRWAERVAALPRGAHVIAYPDAAYELAGLAHVYVAATPRSHTPASLERAGGWLRRGDALDLLELSADRATIAGIAERNPDALILVDDASPAWPTWRDNPPAIFRPQAAGKDFAVFRYDRTALASYLPPGRIMPEEPTAGDVAFVRLDGPVEPNAHLELRHATTGRTIAAAPARPGIVPLATAADAPIGWYRLILADRTLAMVRFGHQYEAESFAIPDLPPSGVPQGQSWFLYDQSFYSRHRAAIATQLVTASRPIQPLPPGRYVVVARVFEYEYAVPNDIAVRLGGASVRLAWESGSNAPRNISNPIRTTTTATRLDLAVTRHEQPWVVVDFLRVYPDDPPP